jgi:hypothetical protein
MLLTLSHEQPVFTDWHALALAFQVHPVSAGTHTPVPGE